MFRSVLAVLLSTAAVVSAQPNIVDVAVSAGFTTLVAAVLEADPLIAAALTGDGPLSKC
jgi:hypothetical protein